MQSEARETRDGAPSRSIHAEGDSPTRLWTVRVVLLTLSFAFRLPALLNAKATNSDAAVVGLQALHMARGEWSAFLWGSGYQTSADAMVATGFFAVLGPTPLALMLSALSLHVLTTFLVFGALRHHVRAVAALVLVLPLVFAPPSVHTYALYPPRQAAITLALAAFCALDAANRARAEDAERRTRVGLALGGLLTMLAVTADPYPLLLVPLAGAFALLVALPSIRRWKVGAVRFAHFVGAAGIGLVPFLLLRRLAGAKSGPFGLTTSMLAHHFDLLVRECLPWALSYKVYFAPTAMDYRAWPTPTAVHLVQLAGAIAVGLVVVYGLAGVFLRSIPASSRRLGLIGALTFPLAIGGFLVSVMVMDHFSMRYLAVLTLMLPFAAVTVARGLGLRTTALVLAPHLVAAALNGWLGYGPFVQGPKVVLGASGVAHDRELLALLRARGVTYAVADYWASYRLTLLWREEAIVVPLNPAEDRYGAYRRAWERAPVFAYVFDRERSRESFDENVQRFTASAHAVERIDVGSHAVLLVTR